MLLFCETLSISAQLILQQPLSANQRVLDFLSVKAFEEFMTSTEDMVGWFKKLEVGSLASCVGGFGGIIKSTSHP